MDSSEVVAGTNATATQYNNGRKDLVLGKHVAGTETDGATVTIDWSDKTKGKIRTVTLGGNRTLAFSNPTQWQTIILRIVQDGTGSRTVTWPATSKFPYAVTPTLSTGAADIDAFGILCVQAGGSPIYEITPLGSDYA